MHSVQGIQARSLVPELRSHNAVWPSKINKKNLKSLLKSLRSFTASVHPQITETLSIPVHRLLIRPLVLPLRLERFYSFPLVNIMKIMVINIFFSLSLLYSPKGWKDFTLFL